MNKRTLPEIELMEKVKDLRDKGFLPKNYDKRIAEKLGLKNNNDVRRVAGGFRFNLDIIKALIEIAEENKEAGLLERIDRVLEK
jgi:uncharacterized protein YjgD (DUF1641 family)